MIQKEDLYGGRKGKISKEDKVIRPGNKWTPHVQSFLSFMHENGFNNIPKPYGINETVFHITSLAFDLPSGVFVDVFGRKKMLIASSVMWMIGKLIMVALLSLAGVLFSRW